MSSSGERETRAQYAARQRAEAEASRETRMRNLIVDVSTMRDNPLYLIHSCVLCGLIYREIISSDVKTRDHLDLVHSDWLKEDSERITCAL